MAHSSIGFPRELLNEPWTARIQYFRTYTMAHPCLVSAREALLNAIHEVPPNSLILVLGPTGVGKTTLRTKVEQVLTAEMLPSLSADSGRIPVVSVECVAPEAGSFSWRAHFRRLLLQMEEPLIDYKIDPESPVRIANMVVRFMPSERAVGAEYQHAVERALAFRRPVAVLVDEVQHLAKMGSGRRLADQLDVVKSLANRTKTVHVLFGTYELLAFRNLSAQLSRRSIDIHFPRYRLANPGDAQSFRTVLRSFEQQLSLGEPPDLVDDWEYFYERSIGCIGILKDWLMRALVSVSRRNNELLSRKDLELHAPSVAQCDKMLSEALEGESRLTESKEERNRLRARLGLNTSDMVPSTMAAKSSSTQRKPGQRRPTRDPIGLNLRTRMQPVFDSWDCTPPAMPPRSRLYALQPIGIETPFVESLSGYLARLADAHAVSVGNLVIRELMILAPITLFHSSEPNIFHGRFYAMNGLGEPARKWLMRFRLGQCRRTCASSRCCPSQISCGRSHSSGVVVLGVASAMKMIEPMASLSTTVNLGLASGHCLSAAQTGAARSLSELLPEVQANYVLFPTGVLLPMPGMAWWLPFRGRSPSSQRLRDLVRE